MQEGVDNQGEPEEGATNKKGEELGKWIALV